MLVPLNPSKSFECIELIAIDENALRSVEKSHKLG